MNSSGRGDLGAEELGRGFIEELRRGPVPVITGSPHETIYRAFLSTWGIAIFLTAFAKLHDPSCNCGEGEAVLPGVRLQVEDAGVPSTLVEHLRNGLARVGTKICAAAPELEVVVVVTGLNYSNVDFQEAALEPAIMQWAAEHFDLEPSTVDVALDESGCRYLFRFGE